MGAIEPADGLARTAEDTAPPQAAPRAGARASGQPAERGVFVLGMHRAGTSAFARAVSLLGVPLAEREALKPASAVNPAGFWEVTALTDLNDELLLELGGHWSSPPVQDASATERAVAVHGERAAEIFTGLHPTGQWVWKDPRNCLTLPFWLEVLAVQPVVVLSHRNPLEIARSLHRRDGLSKPLALALWERYLRSALEHAAGRPTLIVSYADLVEDPGMVCERAGGFLQRHGIECDDDGRGAVSEFVRRDLRHARFDHDEVQHDPDVSPSQRALSALLDDLDGEHPALPTLELGAESPETEALLAARRDAAVAMARMKNKMRRRILDVTQGARLRESLLRERIEELRNRNTALRKKLRQQREKTRRERGEQRAPDRDEGGSA